jgi:hypothetical protein
LENREEKKTENKSKFKDFKSRAKKGETSNNPEHLTLEGNNQASSGNYSSALKNYEEAIKKDEIFSLPARYNTYLANIKSAEGEVAT